MVANENPLETPADIDGSQNQTVEFRCPDGSADIYLLLAGLTVAARSGFEMKDALSFAEKTYVDVNIFLEENKEKVTALASLPASCHESAEMLEKQRAVYEQYEVFPATIIDGIIKDLKKFNDVDIRKEIDNNPNKMMEIVKKYYYCG